MVFRPLPYREPARLVQMWLGFPGRSYTGPYVLSGPEFFDYRDRQNSLESFAVYLTDSGNLTSHGDALRVGVALASREFFTVLGVEPMRGRTFTSEEERPGDGSVAVLSHGFWQSRFGGDPAILEQSLTIDGQPYTIVGIMPPGFAYPSDRVDLWIPIGIDRAAPGPRTSHQYLAVGRLRPDCSLAQASADVARIAGQLTRESPAAYPQQFRWDVHLQSLHDVTVGSVRPTMLMLFGAVGLVLLVACANVANLLLVRGVSRQREMAIRVALGAGRARVVRQLLTESLLISAAAGLLGLGLADLGVQALVAFGPASIPRLHEIAVDWPAAAFTAGLAVLTGILFSVTPALHTVPRNLQQSLRVTIGAAPSARRRRLSHALVVAEVALSLVLLIGAGLLARSFIRLLQVDPGFRTENVLTFNVAAQPPRYVRPEQQVALFERLLPRLSALPGVQAAGAISGLPLTGGFDNGFLMVEGLDPNYPERPLPWGVVNAGWRVASPGYFPALHIALLKGRLVKDSDTAGAPLVAVVDDQFAAQAWPGETNPIGKRVTALGPDGTASEWRTVVGVVRHVLERSLATESLPQVYFPLAQRAFGSLFVTIRTSEDAASLTSLVRSEVKAIDAALPLYDIQTMDDRLGRSVATRRFSVQLMSVFGVVAVTLGVVGLAGVIAYTVSQRTREIGIRMAMGAGRAQVLRLVLGQGLWLVAIGLAIGLAGASALSRVISTMLFGVSPLDPATYALAAAAWLAVALLACYVPAARAMRVDPVTALRSE